MSQRENNIIFEKLTPKNDLNLGAYQDAFDFVFEHDDVTNIAVTGPYSSGKSSIMRSYTEQIEKENKKKKKNIMYVSLANFNVDEVPSNAKEVEKKILNRILHQISSKNIPETKFKLKTSVIKWKFWLSVVMVSLFLLSMIYLIWGFQVRMSLFIYSCINFRYIDYVVPVLYVFGVSFLAYALVKGYQQVRRLKKVNIQGNEIEIFAETEDSCFDKYLNEIIYLFDNSEADVIVFEDMDRFNVAEVFERLREINILINSKPKKKEKLRFFYLIRDDIFTSKDRAKFFDFIIPIVPVIDSSNSYDQLKKRLKDSGFLAEKTEKEFNKKFLKRVSLYIDDMRVLQNICNEFFLYFHKLKNIELDKNKMFAMMIYKNLFPQDYAELQNNAGYVCAVFEKKRKIIRNDRDKWIEQKKKLEKEISDLGAEVSSLYDGEELSRLNKELKKIQYILDAGESLPLTNFLMWGIDTQDFFDNIISNENDETDKKKQVERKKLNNVRESKYFPLLEYLLLHGYIDEKYSDYMTYFYPHSLTEKDKNYILNISTKMDKDYENRLDSVEEVFSQLQIYDFHQMRNLRMDLLDYLLSKNSGEEKQALEIFIKRVMEDQRLDFVENFLKFETKNRGLFVRTLNQNWFFMFSDVAKIKQFSEEALREYILLTLYESSEKELSKLKLIGYFRRCLEQMEKCLLNQSSEIEKLIERLKLLDFKFKKLNYQGFNQKLLEGIYENKLYALTLENVNYMLEKMYKEEFSTTDLESKNYTCIMTEKESGLANYVNENIESYLKLIITSNVKLKDEEDQVLSILNHSELSKAVKEKYIEKLESRIENLTDVEDKELWASLLKTKNIDYSEQNIYDYFHWVGKIDEVLIQFINLATRSLDFAILHLELTDKIWAGLIACNALSDEIYLQILKSFEWRYIYFDIKNLTKSKINYLIEQNKIEMNFENMNHMRFYYPNSKWKFIDGAFDEYSKLIEREKFISDDELEYILHSKRNSTEKIHFLCYSNTPISIGNQNYENEVIEHILENNYDKRDFAYLVSKYSQFSEGIKRIIENKALHEPYDIDKLINRKRVDRYLLEELLGRMEAGYIGCIFEYFVSECKTKRRLISVLKKMNLTNLQEYENILNQKPFEEVFMTEENEEILKVLLKYGWIQEYHEVEGEYYMVSPRKKW